MNQKIISKLFKNKEILFDKVEENGIYLNATKTAKHFKKDVREWKRSKQTIEYIEALSGVGFSHSTLIKTVEGNFSDGRIQGTWIHQKLVVMFARWLNPNFAVWCDLQIEEILKLKTSQPTKTPKVIDDFNFAQQTQKNREILEFIELITSQSPKNLFFLDKIYKSLNKSSPLDLLQIDLNSFYFIPTELGKFFNKSAVEINKILEKKGFQEKIDGVWILTESGKNYAIQLDNSFKTIKWKLESLV